jgi:hypothetical protein
MNPGSAKTGFVVTRSVAAEVEAVKAGTSAAGADWAPPVCLRARFLAGEGDLRVAMEAPFPAWESGWYEDTTQKSNENSMI